MVEKMKVPRSRIPKVHAVCPICSNGTKSVLGSPFADGYHRRHVCKCGYAFYTLAPYNGAEVQVCGLPFKDRALTEYEVEQRLQWWRDEENREVTTEVIVWELPEAVKQALAKAEEERNETEHRIVHAYYELMSIVNEIEGKQHERPEACT